MKMIFSLVYCLVASSLLFAASAAAGGNPEGEGGFPDARMETYRDPANSTRHFLVQEPDNPGASPNILIYMHGSAGKEEQGMDPEWSRRSFSRLRTLMNDWGWVYVCPRDAEFKGLLQRLSEKYRPRAVYLAGASAGGNQIIREASKNPDAYAGLLLMCPVVRDGRGYAPGKLTMPLWIVSGEKDPLSGKDVRALVEKLEGLKKTYFHVEIKGGNHGTPVEEVDWKAALQFLQDRREGQRRLAGT